MDKINDIQRNNCAFCTSVLRYRSVNKDINDFYNIMQEEIIIRDKRFPSYKLFHPDGTRKIYTKVGKFAYVVNRMQI